jgi:uncharacterized protein
MLCRFVSIGRPLSLLVILLLLLALGLVSLLTCGACPGLKDAGASERSDAAWYAPKRYGDEASQRYTDLVVSSRYLTMRDGVKIAIDVLLPKGLEPGAKIPAILDQTRYWRSFALRWPFSLFVRGILNEPEKRRFVTHGYAWVDVRGTGASYGHCPVPGFSTDQIRDEAEIVDWVIQQPWSNGKVGATGTSYGGTTAELLLANRHPAVRAIAPRFSLFDEYTDITFPGGVYFSSFVEPWGQFTTTLDRNVVPDDLPVWMRLVAKLGRVGVRPVDADRDRSMLFEAVRAHGENYRDFKELSAVIYRDDVAPSGWPVDSESAHRLASDTQASGAAIYSYDGWFDGGYGPAAIKRYLTVQTPGSRLIIGPWTHAGPRTIHPFGASSEPRFDQMGELLRFFDFHLKGSDTGIAAEKPVHYFTVGEDKWKEADSWPPPAASMVSYYVGAGNRLSTERAGGPAEGRPSSLDGSDSDRVDSHAGSGHQTHWDGLIGFSHAYDFVDREVEDNRLLAYTSAPLDRDVEVTGYPVITLFVSSTGTDGQFFVYLEDVDEHGRVFAVTDGQLRAIHRELSAEEPPYRDVVPYHSFKRQDGMPLVPGEVTELTFDLLPTSYLFTPGHSIRVALAGADTDHFIPLPADPPTLQIYRDRVHASRIDLPMIPR